MKHPLEKYWRSVFGQYRSADHTYRLPLFPDPLMSPNFGGPSYAGYVNRITTAGIPTPRNFRPGPRFKIGTCDITVWPAPPHELEIVPLHVAVTREDFWQILGESFPKDLPFLRNLLPFLPVTNAVYKTAFIKDRGEIAGLVNVGVSGGHALVLTAAILPQARGKKLTHHIVDIAGYVARKNGAHTAIYWTEYSYLLKYAHEIQDYQIFFREKRPKLEQDERTV